MKESCGVKVLARFRPFNQREKDEYAGKEQTLKLTFNGGSVKVDCNMNKHDFNFDMCFPPESAQDAVFECIKPSLKDIEDGYNGTIFAYGQTGSGKTFTMFGPDGYEKYPEQWGVIPRACTMVFEMINKNDAGVEYSITGSFLEVYNETIRDLIDPRKDNLMVRESPAKGIYVEDLTSEYLSSPEDVWALIALGDANKAKAATSMNARSSRSHTVFIMQLHQKMKDGTTKSGKLNLVDLAGSEKVGKTGATGELLEQAKNINKSLSALGNCINALTAAKKVHIPYRDSKLTRILQESLGGNCKTTLIICCSPHEFNIEETVGTLRFGARAKLIKNTIKANVLRSAEELEKLLTKLTSEYAKLQKYCKSLEEVIEWMKSPDYAPGKECPIKLVKPGEDKDEKEGGEAGGDEEGDDGKEESELHSIPEGQYNPLKTAEQRLDNEKAATATADERDHLKSELARLVEKEGDLQSKIQTVTTELAQARAAEKAIRDSVQQERDVWKGEKNKLEYELKQKTNEAEAAIEEQNRYHSQILQLQKALAEAQSHVSSGGGDEETKVLKKQLHEADERLKELQSKLDEQAATQADLDQECADLHELIGMLEEDSGNAKDEADEANQKVGELSEKLRKKEAESAALSKEGEELKTKMQRLDADMKAEIAALEIKLKGLQDQLASAQKRESAMAKSGVDGVAASSHEIVDLQHKVDSLQAQVAEESSAKLAAVKKMEEEISQAAERTKTVAEKLTKAQHEAKEKSDEVEAIKSQLNAAIQEKKKLEQQSEADQTRQTIAEKQKEALQTQIKEMRDVEDQLRLDLRKAQEAAARAQAGGADIDQLKQAKQKEASLLQENLQLKRDLEAKTSKSVTQLKQMEQQALRMLQLEEELSQCRKAQNELREALNAAKRSEESLQESIVSRDHKIAELEGHLASLPLQRRAKLFVPIKSANAIANALAAKEEFGQHLLRKTDKRPAVASP